MRRIGDYIHYKYENYEKYGTTIDKGKNDRIEVLKKHKQDLKEKVAANQSKSGKKKIKRDLEKQLNFFFWKGKGNESKIINNTEFTPQDLEEIRKIVLEIFMQAASKARPKLSKYIQNAEYDLDTLSASIVSDDLQAVDNIIQRARIGEGKGGYTWDSAIKSRIEALVEEVNNLNLNDSVLTPEQIAEVDSLKREFEKIESELKAKAKEQEARSIAWHKKRNKDRVAKLDPKYRKVEVKGHEDFFKRLNALTNDVRSGRIKVLKGLMGEFMPAIIQYVMDNFTHRAEANFVEQVLQGINVVGDQRTAFILDSSKFVGSDFGEDATRAFDIGTINVKTRAVQNKVDLTLSVPGSKSNKKIKVSAKNYNLKYKDHIHLLSGTSLLKMLQDYPNFANHYANITAAHPGGISPKEDVINQAHDLMKMTLGAYAIAGGVYGRDESGAVGHSDQAEILLVNDSSQGKFTVYFVDEIVKLMLNDVSLLEIKGYIKNPEWENVFIDEITDNKKLMVKQAFRRSMSIVNQMHHFGYSVSFNIKTAQKKI